METGKAGLRIAYSNQKLSTNRTISLTLNQDKNYECSQVRSIGLFLNNIGTEYILQNRQDFIRKFWVGIFLINKAPKKPAVVAERSRASYNQWCFSSLTRVQIPPRDKNVDGLWCVGLPNTNDCIRPLHLVNSRELTHGNK